MNPSRSTSLALVGIAVLGIIVVGTVFVVGFQSSESTESYTETPSPTPIVDPTGNEALVSISTYDFEGDPPVPQEIEVFFRFRGYDDLHYEDVMLCLYGENGSVLQAENVGSISLENRSSYSNRTTVTVESSEVPYFILIDHPGLRNDTRVNSEVYVWDPERETYWIPNENYPSPEEAFGYPRSNETGVCG